MRVVTRDPVVSDLAAIVGPAAVKYEPRDLVLYSYDATLYTARPDYVVLPANTEQVAAVVRLAQKLGIPVTPRGGGTSLSGGPVPVEGGIVVCLSRMAAILELDVANRRAVVQPGVINLDLLGAAEKQGFFYAPDPASQIACTLGGNVAENSGGPHCLKYGVTTNHVLGVELVLPDGTVMRTGGKALDWPGYDLTGVIVGSEGTFGIVTEITCRLLPLPQAVTTMLAIFDNLQDASQTVSDIIAAGLLPATLEMMDRPLIEAVQTTFDAGYPEDAEVVLIIEVDGLAASMQRQLASIRGICERHHVRKFQAAANEAERVQLWKGRKGAFGAVANISPNKLCTDVAVPRTELPRVLAEVMAIGERHGLRMGNVFHAGDGNLHPQVLFDARDPDQLRRVEQADEEITRLAVSVGGVLTGEHGIGCCKRKWMPVMFTAADLRAMWTLKDVFDPDGRMNPAKVLPDRRSLAEPQRWTLPHGGFEEVAGRLVPRGADGECQPYDAEAAAKLMALAARESQKLVIRGGGTKSGPVAPERQVISTLGLKQILSVDPQNLTIQAEAGVRWADLQAALASAGQFVPLFPSQPREATVGGVVASNAGGPQRLRYGSCRDLVTGLRVVLPDGEIVSVGSRCVKNTSGYALEKLFIGSRGSLGLILDVTFRTLPLPEQTLALLFRMKDTDPASVGDQLARFTRGAVGGPLLPAAVELVSPVLARECARRCGVDLRLPDEGWAVLVGLEGLVEEVQDMTTAFGALAMENGMELVATAEAPVYADLWEAAGLGGRPVAQVTCEPALTAQVAAALRERLGTQVALRAGLGTGLIAVSAEPRIAVPAESLIAELDVLATDHGGRAYWLPPVPDGVRNPELSGPAARVCRRLKAAFDPGGILPTVF